MTRANKKSTKRHFLVGPGFPQMVVSFGKSVLKKGNGDESGFVNTQNWWLEMAVAKRVAENRI